MMRSMFGPDAGPALVYDTAEGESIATNIKSHRYMGEDKSLLYKNLLSPLASIITMKFVPVSAHPNLITLLGLVATICGFVGTIVVSLYSTLPISSITVYPAWLHLLLSLCYFLYQTLDNIDGKQARRTGTSSSLGYVFDHGCDAINSTIGTLNLFVNLNVTGICVAKNGESCPLPIWKQWLLWETVAVGFYFNTWEEFYTGMNDFTALP